MKVLTKGLKVMKTTIMDKLKNLIKNDPFPGFFSPISS